MNDKQGFTLIELSIVLVIIGLITGGVLVGQDLIRAAEIRATISQIEKFNTANNTFYGKYQALPGDMNYSTRAENGFNITGTTSAATGCGSASASGGANTGNGDGIIGYDLMTTASVNLVGNEQGCYWVDISSGQAGNLVEGGFSSADLQHTPLGLTITQFAKYLPAAKVGKGILIYPYAAGGINYFGMSNISAFGFGTVTSTGALSPAQAYNIDKKTDDGYPNSGNVFAWYLNGGTWVPSTSHSPAAAANQDCFDNGGSVPATPYSWPQGTYATNINGGAGTGCGLSFKFQ